MVKVPKNLGVGIFTPPPVGVGGCPFPLGGGRVPPFPLWAWVGVSLPYLRVYHCHTLGYIIAIPRVYHRHTLGYIIAIP